MFTADGGDSAAILRSFLHLSLFPLGRLTAMLRERKPFGGLVIQLQRIVEVRIFNHFTIIGM